MEDDLLAVSQQSKLATDVYRVVDPLNFYNNFLKEGIRPDGRNIISYRKTTVKDLLNSNIYSTNYSSSTYTSHSYPPNKEVSSYLKKIEIKNSLKNVNISSILLNSGNSQYHCTIIGDLMYYDKLSLNLGELDYVFSVDVNVPKHVINEIHDINGPCINISHIVSEHIQNVINSSDVIPKSQFFYDLLCSGQNSKSFKDDKIVEYLKNYKLRWNLKMEIICDEYDGNLMDMSLLCCSHALMNSKFPFVILSGDSKHFHPTLLNYSDFKDLSNNNEKKKLIQLNQEFLILQIQNSVIIEEIETFDQLSNYMMSQNFWKKMEFNSLPFTITFCKCLDYFLLDPTSEEEQIGVNFSIYCLKRLSDDNNLKNDVDELSLQPLNPMGLEGFTEDVLEKLYEIYLLM